MKEKHARRILPCFRQAGALTLGLWGEAGRGSGGRGLPCIGSDHGLGGKGIGGRGTVQVTGHQSFVKCALDKTEA